ncbi:unnamed protein product [Protopolystoma xenopodis]|uniref:Uncharacterized protein n=1 Tax=Protopolystoma xenopodis TaxID=117903 RepID=A0A448XBF6_9PLAT|nr:unnamed protein product [Protopolystoma xenopodis]
MLSAAWSFAFVSIKMPGIIIKLMFGFFNCFQGTFFLVFFFLLNDEVRAIHHKSRKYLLEFGGNHEEDEDGEETHEEVAWDGSCLTPTPHPILSASESGTGQQESSTSETGKQQFLSPVSAGHRRSSIMNNPFTRAWIMRKSLSHANNPLASGEAAGGFSLAAMKNQEAHKSPSTATNAAACGPVGSLGGTLDSGAKSAKPTLIHKNKLYDIFAGSDKSMATKTVGRMEEDQHKSVTEEFQVAQSPSFLQLTRKALEGDNDEYVEDAEAPVEEDERHDNGEDAEAEEEDEGEQTYRQAYSEDSRLAGRKGRELVKEGQFLREAKPFLENTPNRSRHVKKGKPGWPKVRLN